MTFEWIELYKDVGMISEIDKSDFDLIKNDLIPIIEKSTDNKDQSIFKYLPPTDIEYNQHLVANIEGEYSVYNHKKYFEKSVISLAKKYSKHVYGQEYDWEIPVIWVNCQKKYEYNSLHYHQNDLVFVIWAKIPYDLKEELGHSNDSRVMSTSNSLFYFVVPNDRNNVDAIPLYIDKSWEGKIVIFPSHVQHLVYPFFTSDGYRISFAGNLKKKIKDKEEFVLSYY